MIRYASEGWSSSPASKHSTIHSVLYLKRFSVYLRKNDKRKDVAALLWVVIFAFTLGAELWFGLARLMDALHDGDGSDA